jgi:hypothetical protein
MRVAIYARISTIGNGRSPEMQLREFREYVARRGWELAGEYVDEGISGAKDSRPELNRLTEDAQKRRFDCVLVHGNSHPLMPLGPPSSEPHRECEKYGYPFHLATPGEFRTP